METQDADGYNREEIESLRVGLAPQERTLQLVHIVIFLGALTAVGVLFFLCKRIGGNDVPAPNFFLMLAAVPFALSWIIPAVMRSNSPRDDDRTPEQLAVAYQVSHIVGCAMMDTSVLVCSIPFIVAPSVPQWFVSVPAALLVVLLLRFPRKGTMFDWIASKLETR